MSNYTNCTEVREEFSALLDKELSAEAVEAIELHLSECAECLRELNAMKQVVELYNELPTQSAPDDFVDGVHEALDEDAIAFSRSKSSSQRVSYRPVFLAAATLALMAGVSYIAMQGLNGDTQYAKAPEASMEVASVEETVSQLSEQEALKKEAAYWGDDEAEEAAEPKEERPEFIKGTPEYDKRIELTMKLRKAQGTEKAPAGTFEIVMEDIGHTPSGETHPTAVPTEEKLMTAKKEAELAELIRNQFTVQGDGLWIQKGFSDQPITLLEPGTQEYINFLFSVPNLQNLVRHTRDLIFEHEDNWYRIAHEGPLLHDRVLGPPHPKSRKRAEDLEAAN